MVRRFFLSWCTRAELTMGEIPPSRIIQSPGELASLIRELKAAVAAGDIEQILHPGSATGDVAIGDVPESGPWPDHLELRFAMRDGTTRYRLSVETYHGTGGTWGAD